MNDVRRSDPPTRAFVVALWVLAALVVLPAGCLAYALFHTERWEGDVPAVVTELDGAYYDVDLTAPLPADALTTGADGGLVFERAGDLRVGDPVTCRVVQTYTVNTDIGQGPQSEIESCRR